MKSCAIALALLLVCVQADGAVTVQQFHGTVDDVSGGGSGFPIQRGDRFTAGLVFDPDSPHTAVDLDPNGDTAMAYVFDPPGLNSWTISYETESGHFQISSRPDGRFEWHVENDRGAPASDGICARSSQLVLPPGWSSPINAFSVDFTDHTASVFSTADLPETIDPAEFTGLSSGVILWDLEIDGQPLPDLEIRHHVASDPPHTPEPASVLVWGLLGLALAWLGCWRCRPG